MDDVRVFYVIFLGDFYPLISVSVGADGDGPETVTFLDGVGSAFDGVFNFFL